MIAQRPVQKGFFARNWIWLLGGVILLFVAAVVAAALIFLFVLRGDAKLSDLKLSVDTPVYGQALKAEVTATNSGFIEMNYHAVLMVDGEAAQSQEVVLDHNQPRTLEFDISRLQAGSHKLSIGTLEKDFKILKPAEFKVGPITFAPAAFYVGDTVTVSASVTNLGEVPGTFQSGFTYDGAGLETEPVEIGPGEDGAVMAQFRVDAKGTHAVSIEDQKSTFTALNPAKISVVDMKLSKVYVKPDETFVVTVTLQNAGDAPGSFSLKLMLNGAVLQSQSVKVDGGVKQLATFKVSQTNTGKYTLKAGDISKVFSVVIITRPANGTYLVKTAKASSGSYLQVNNYYSDKDMVFVLAASDNPKKVLLSVYLREGQSIKKIYVKTGYYVAYYTAGTNYDSASKRFLTAPVYFKLTAKNFYPLDFYKYWFTLYCEPGSSDYTSINEADFPK